MPDDTKQLPDHPLAELQREAQELRRQFNDLAERVRLLEDRKRVQGEIEEEHYQHRDL